MSEIIIKLLCLFLLPLAACAPSKPSTALAPQIVTQIVTQTATITATSKPSASTANNSQALIPPIPPTPPVPPTISIPSPVPPPPPKPLSESELQQKRAQLIAELHVKGFFAKVEVIAGTPRVWINPIFYTLAFDDKQAFISVVYAYYNPGKVVVVDNMNGKEIGEFSKTYGGLKMY